MKIEILRVPSFRSLDLSFLWTTFVKCTTFWLFLSVLTYYLYATIIVLRRVDTLGRMLCNKKLIYARKSSRQIEMNYLRTFPQVVRNTWCWLYGFHHTIYYWQAGYFLTVDLKYSPLTCFAYHFTHRVIVAGQLLRSHWTTTLVLNSYIFFTILPKRKIIFLVFQNSSFFQKLRI